MKKLLLAIVYLATFCSVESWGQAVKDDGKSNVMLSVSGELNSADVWRLEGACHWFPIPYVGVGGSLGIWKQYFADVIPKSNNWAVTEDYSKPSNLYVQPSVVLLSPDFVKGDGWGIHLYGEVGVMINVPYEKVEIGLGPYQYINYDYDYVSSNKGKFCFLDYKLGLSFKIDNVTLTAGYSYSGLDIYSMRRKMVYDHTCFDTFYPRPKGTHGAFITLSVNL